MRYLMVFAAGRREAITIEATRASISADCRAAALSFMAGARGWSKRDLARWLVGPYSHATRHVAHVERTFTCSGPRVDAGAVEALLRSAHDRLLGELAATTRGPRWLTFVEDVMARDLVRRALDADGSEAWIPVDGAPLRLVDRVASLFVADWLIEPAAYASLRVCRRCDGVFVDGGCRSCPAHELLRVAEAS